mmetsp:Transcript_93511/g.171599  ORF Transcript_93511/g.171599 Transcript_93511/m.171599 type:complete len:177 (+) Transcript_93511:67-597(+)
MTFEFGNHYTLLLVAALSKSALAICLIYCWAVSRRHDREQRVTERRRQAPPSAEDYASLERRLSERESQTRETPGEMRTYGRQDVEHIAPAVPAIEPSHCVVCMQPIVVGEQVRWMSCAHVLHAQCILDWWTHQPRVGLECPVCRQVQIDGTHELEQGQGAPQEDVEAATNNADAV